MADIHKTETRGRYDEFGSDLSAPGGPDDDNKADERAQIGIRNDQATRWRECPFILEKGHGKSKVFRHTV